MGRHYWNNMIHTLAFAIFSLIAQTVHLDNDAAAPSAAR